MNHDALIDALIDRLSGYVETSRLGTIRYYNSDGELHRTDGPAVIYAYGTKFWCQHGERHRLDGPAVIYSDGSEAWYINGVEVTKNDHARLAAEIQSHAS